MLYEAIMGRAAFRRFLITVHVAKENEDSSGIESRGDLHRLPQLARSGRYFGGSLATGIPNPSREIAGLPESRSAGVTSTDRSSDVAHERKRNRETARGRQRDRDFGSPLRICISVCELSAILLHEWLNGSMIYVVNSVSRPGCRNSSHGIRGS